MTTIAKNYINIAPSDLDRPVYRIMSVDRCVECVSERKLTLVSPRMWDDPFENLLLAATVKLENGEIGDLRSVRDSIFAQCWTKHRETDAMWRIYSSKNDGVRVRSTPRKLLTALMLANPDFSTDGLGIARSLLYKRREFAHELEVRLIYHAQPSAAALADTYSFSIDPNDIFEQAIFDPRMDRSLYDTRKAVLEASGYTNKIGQSILYRPPPGLIIRI